MAQSCSLACTRPGEAVSFATMLTEAIADRALTLDEIETELSQRGARVSRTTLSYWKNGRSVPFRDESLAAVEVLEDVLGVPAGQLVGRLTMDHDDLAVQAPGLIEWAALEDELTRHGLATGRAVSVEYLYDSVEVDRDGRGQRQTTSQLVSAERDGVDRVTVLCGRRGGRHPRLVEAMGGCRLGRVVALPRRDLVAIELLLHQPLAAGELRVLDYRITRRLDPDDLEQSVVRVLKAPISYLVMEVGFAGQVPARVRYFRGRVASQGVDELEGRARRHGARDHFQVSVADPTPGLHVLRWGR